MALSLKKQVAAANARLRKRCDDVYACAPTDHTPFSRCIELAAGVVAEEYEMARVRLRDLEYEALMANKAYRSTLGTLTWYR